MTLERAFAVAILLSACSQSPSAARDAAALDTKPAPRDSAPPPDVATNDAPTDAPLDASTGADAPAMDAAVMDALATDATAPDTAAVDVPAMDAPPDAPPFDAPLTDTPAPDAPPPDAPPPDAPLTDAPAPDVGADAAPVDAGGGYVRPPRVAVPPLRRVELDGGPFVRTDAGTYVLFQTEHGSLEHDPAVRDPVTALGACAALVAGCVGRPSPTLDQCVTSAPACATATPWTEASPCCPAACVDAYEAARRRGVDDLAAFETVYFTAPDCFPGVRAMLGGSP